jgi:hypothetical protein
MASAFVQRSEKLVERHHYFTTLAIASGGFFTSTQTDRHLHISNGTKVVLVDPPTQTASFEQCRFSFRDVFGEKMGCRLPFG